MPNQISYAEMIAAVTQTVRQWAEEEAFFGGPTRPKELAAMRAVLAHLERTQWRPIEDISPGPESMLLTVIAG